MATSPAANADAARIAPALRELIALRGAARALPSWRDPRRLRQAGPYLSRIKGRGMEYDESRPYQPGDDIRTLDWRVTARTGKAHTKLFREERERPVFIACDVSAGMRFATRGVFKVVQAARAAALLAWRAHLSGDRVGGLVFADGSHEEIEPRGGELGPMRLLKALAEAGAAPSPVRPDGAPLSAALTRMRRLVKPGSVVVILSDLHALDDELTGTLADLARHSDLMLVRVFDPLEMALPKAGSDCRVTDGQREFRLPLADRAFRERYAERATERRAFIERICRTQRMFLCELATTDEPVQVLQRALAR